MDCRFVHWDDERRVEEVAVVVVVPERNSGDCCCCSDGNRDDDSLDLEHDKAIHDREDLGTSCVVVVVVDGIGAATAADFLDNDETRIDDYSVH